MILKNFKIEESHGIEYEGKFLDLHSNYDFVKFSYDISCQSVALYWNKSEEDWAVKEPFENLRLQFNSISIFAVRSRDDKKPFSEDDCLSYIGYMHPDDIEIMNGFLPKKMANDKYHLVLGFESGMAIKLFCETAELFSKSMGPVSQPSR
ncbi:MAG: hypothetical protein V4732_04045 [Pseudomonadota bacterium]